MALPPDAHKKLRSARAYSGIEQAEAAKKLGYSRTHWGAVERGTKGLPSVSVLREAMALFGVPFSYLEREGHAAFDQPAAFEELDERLTKLAASTSAEFTQLRRDLRAATAAANKRLANAEAEADDLADEPGPPTEPAPVETGP